jgi:trk system potassium uptake protein TrkA
VFIVILGGGKVGGNLARTLLARGTEIVVVESDPRRFDRLEQEFGHRAIRGDATELYVLERAGIKRPPDIVVAATGDDEDNVVICQLATERYGVPKVIARVNDPRNQATFDLLGIAPTVSPTQTIMALIEHEVPEHELVHLLELRRENLDIVEVEIGKDSPAAGKRVEELRLPENARLISVMHGGEAEIAVGSTELHPGDQVLAIIAPGAEEELRVLLLADGKKGGDARSTIRGWRS